jgi:hypothetical protein
VLVKIFFDYVIRRLNALSAGSEKPVGGLTFAEAPLSAISRFNWSVESTAARGLIKRLVKMALVPRGSGAVNPK